MLFGLRLKRPKRLPGGEQLSLANQPRAAGRKLYSEGCGDGDGDGDGSCLGWPAARRGAGPPAPQLFLYQSNGPGNIPGRELGGGGGEREGESRENKRGKKKLKPPPPKKNPNPSLHEVNEKRMAAKRALGQGQPRRLRGRGALRGRSARGGSGSAPPRRACGRAGVCKKAPTKSCSKNDKPSGKWTHGAARMYFFIFDNLCPKETILKIIEMITIHCCLTLSRNSQIMKS